MPAPARSAYCHYCVAAGCLNSQALSGEAIIDISGVSGAQLCWDLGLPLPLQPDHRLALCNQLSSTQQVCKSLRLSIMTAARSRKDAGAVLFLLSPALEGEEF
jgi:hypothetical protein